MNVMEIREEVSKVLDKIRKDGGPYLLEIMTYRYRGHSMGDPERYRDKAEVRKWEEEDPIGIFRNYLIENKIANADELDEEDEEAQKIVEEAEAFAKSSPNPGKEALFEDVYVDPTPIEYKGYAMEHESKER
jgi:pyruvate dehydrogenase E1 component alpha subunit